MIPLFLSAQEQTLFQALPDAVREGWVVEQEDGVFVDSLERRTMRLSLTRLQDVSLKAFIANANAVPSAEALATMMHDADLQDVDEGDLAELFFALGPDIISALVSSLLGEAKTDEDMNGIAALTAIRNSFYRSAS